VGSNARQGVFDLGGGDAGVRPAAAQGACVPPAVPLRSPRKASDVVSAILVAEEEPIARAVRIKLARFSKAWNSGSINTPGKVAIILVAAYMLVIKGIVIIPAAVSALMVYACYYAIRAIIIACRTPSSADRATLAHRPAAPVARPAAPPESPVVNRPAAPAPAPPYYRRPVVERPRLPPKPARQRFEELIGSMLGSTVVAALMSVFLSVVHAKAFDLGQFAWLLIVSTLGSWLVLIPSKFWEGREGDSTLRRLMLMVLGLGLGAAAWSIKDFLLVSLTADWKLPDPVTEGYMGTRLYEVDGSPSLVGHMGYFAFLFLLVRWWKQADPLRPSRLRVWPTVTAIFWAWLLYFFWPFPQPWGTMVAASVSIAVQIASSWERGTRRFTS
jgi:hypothetical protein